MVKSFHTHTPVLTAGLFAIIFLFVYFCFCFGFIPNCSQDLLLTLCSEISPVCLCVQRSLLAELRGLHGVAAEIKPRSSTCKVRALPVAIFLQPLQLSSSPPTPIISICQLPCLSQAFLSAPSKSTTEMLKEISPVVMNILEELKLLNSDR